MNKPELLLVYDKECPACNTYCRLIRTRETVGSLKIIDARKNSRIMDEITRSGLDIDQGMVLIIGEKLYYGSDAMHSLALISSRSGIFNRINYWVFKSKSVSSLLYPVLRVFRNLLLKILGKMKINNLSKHKNNKF
jgi:predicted DCC family thiol-disulfide oxidoreductase YuxK